MKKAYIVTITAPNGNSMSRPTIAETAEQAEDLYCSYNAGTEPENRCDGTCTHSELLAIVNKQAIEASCELSNTWDTHCLHRLHCKKCDIKECGHGGFGFRDHEFVEAE